MRDQDYGGVAGYVDQLADRVESASDYLKQQDVGDFIHGLERYAKREPAIFIGGAVAVGVIAARFLKSSGERSRRSGRQNSGQTGSRGYSQTSSQGYGQTGSRGYSQTGSTSPYESGSSY